MRTGEGTETWRYWAFISYSHADATFAKRLQRGLETYRIPRALVGRVTRSERIPRTLSPIFLDREDLRGGPDLGGVIKEHLEGSRYLVVVCSTAAAQSAWETAKSGIFRALVVLTGFCALSQPRLRRHSQIPTLCAAIGSRQRCIQRVQMFATWLLCQPNPLPPMPVRREMVGRMPY